MAEIVVPDFRMTGMYYPEFVEDLTDFKRREIPELSDEDAAELTMQLISVLSAGLHMLAVLLDGTANEMFLPTARLRESVRAKLQRVGLDLAQPSPATAGILLKLSTPFAVDTLIVPRKATFATVPDGTTPGVGFEILDDYTISRSDQPGFLWSYDAGGDTWTKHALDAAFSTGTPAAGSALYIGHDSVMWDRIRLDTDVAIGDVTTGVWEYYDGNYNEDSPDTVVDNGSTLTLSLNGWLGSANRTGTIIRVKSNLTGRYEDNLAVYYSGGTNKVDTTTLLGQSSPSTLASDYTVGSLWHALPDVDDQTNGLTTLGAQNVDYTLPQSVLQNWRKATIGPTGGQEEAYWVRYRIIAIGGAPSAGQVGSVSISDGSTYLLVTGTQGQSWIEAPLGSSNGEPLQSFRLANGPVIDDSNIHCFVTEDGVENEWTRVDNWLNSSSTDRHFIVSFDAEGFGIFHFGDGKNGKIPQAGVNNLRASYRTMTDQNGNVGPNTITINQTGVAYINTATNPRQATGYSTAEGSTPEDLARIKIDGPARLRTQGRAVTPDDIEALTVAFTAVDGTQPFSRALAVEEGFGPKTVKVVVVGQAGQAADQNMLDELEDYLNGVADNPDYPGVLLLNTQATAVNFTSHPINVTATVYGGNETAVKNALADLLDPGSQESDGSYVWNFGEEVPVSKIIAAIMATSPAPRKVTVSTPGSDTALAADELPTAGTFTITVV